MAVVVVCRPVRAFSEVIPATVRHKEGGNHDRNRMGGGSQWQ